VLFVPGAKSLAGVLARDYELDGIRWPGAQRVARDLGWSVAFCDRFELEHYLCARGLAALVHCERLILVRRGLFAVDRERAIFHELGHVILERYAADVCGWSAEMVERWCDRFAARCLALELANLD
jgi:hypothetical protein